MNRKTDIPPSTTQKNKPMKTPIKTAILLLQMLFASVSMAQTAPAAPTSEKETIKLTSGETMTGKIAGVNQDSLNLATDYGVIKIPLAKLTEESRKKLKLPEETDVTKLKARISELEALVANLREENATLRKTGTPTASPQPQAAKSSPKPAATGESGVTYKLSKSGKRHNSRCRYFSSAGDTCGPNDGEPCKVCGG